MAIIHHITTQAAWEAGVAAGGYRAATLDTEGFIHCSTPAQTVATANKYFQGRKDLVLLEIDDTRAGEVRYEAPAPLDGVASSDERAGQRFPHIYGALPLDAVIRAAPWSPGADGFRLPAP